MPRSRTRFFRDGICDAWPAWLRVFVALQLAGCGGVNTDFQTVHTIPIKDASIVIEAAQSSLAYGPATIRIRHVDNLNDEVVYESKIANDGGQIAFDNIRPDARSDRDLRLCLNGVEQDDVYVRIDVGVKAVVEIQRPCTE